LQEQRHSYWSIGHQTPATRYYQAAQICNFKTPFLLLCFDSYLKYFNKKSSRKKLLPCEQLFVIFLNINLHTFLLPSHIFICRNSERLIYDIKKCRISLNHFSICIVTINKTFPPVKETIPTINKCDYFGNFIKRNHLCCLVMNNSPIFSDTCIKLQILLIVRIL